MPPVEATRTVRVSPYGTYGTQTWACVLHGYYDADATAADLADDIATAFSANLLGALDSEVTMTGANYVDLSGDNGESGPVPSWTGPVSGGASGAGSPGNVAYLLHWGAPGTRRQRNGRTYLPGVPDAAVNENGLIDSSYFDGLEGRQEDFFEQVNSGGNGVLAILSKTSAGGHIARVVSSYSVDPRVATQRRRLRR